MPGVIPPVLNLPQKSNYGLYIERISGSSFTVPRKDSKQTWLYRLLPSICHGESIPVPDHPLDKNQQLDRPMVYSPTQVVWAPVPIVEENDFLSGLKQLGGAGDPVMKSGVAYYVFTAGISMQPDHAFASSDGDFLLGTFTSFLLHHRILTL